MGYRVASVVYWRPEGVVHRKVPPGSCSTFQRGSCLSLWSRRHLGPPLHRQLRPPASYGMLCSKSHCVAGLRQPGPVQVAFRIWERCRSLTPGSWPRAWYRWSQPPTGIGSRVTTRSHRPSVPVCSRQAPYPSGGPGWPVVVKANPVRLVVPVPRGGSRPSGGPDFPRLAWCLLWLLGSGRAHPWPMAWPCSSVTVTHQVVFGFCAVARARSRTRPGSMGPIPTFHRAGDIRIWLICL